MNFNVVKVRAKLILMIICVLFLTSCDEKVTEPKISTPLDVELSTEVYVLDKDFKIYPQPNIEIFFHESVILNSSVKQEEFYERTTCSKGWVIERRNFELNENEEIIIGVLADTLNSGEYIYKSINYNQLVDRADSNNSVLLLFPFTVYR